MHVDGCLWYKVLVARYSEEDGRINEGGSLGSVWWKDLQSIQSCVGSGVDNWFKDKLIQVVGDGDNFFFFFYGCWRVIRCVICSYVALI